MIIVFCCLTTLLDMHQHVIYMADKEYYCSLLDPQLKITFMLNILTKLEKRNSFLSPKVWNVLPSDFSKLIQIYFSKETITVDSRSCYQKPKTILESIKLFTK